MVKIEDFIAQQITYCQTMIEIIENDKNKTHPGVIEYHRGELAGLQKIANLLDVGTSMLYDRGTLLEWYVAARTDHWKCFSAVPKSDFWDHAFLKKGRQKAEINISSGTLMVWRPDGSQVEQPMPYEDIDFRR